MRPVCLHDRAEIERFLRKNPALHIYELGDLDDFFWPYTTWFANKIGQDILALALLYTGTDYPVLLAFDEAHSTATVELLRSLRPILPARCYAHLSPGLVDALTAGRELRRRGDSHGQYYKMALTRPEHLGEIATDGVEAISPRNQVELETFYRESYPGNWFDPRMLETGCYVGMRHEGRIVCAAGVHVYSPAYGVAALGNITTHPDWRGQGLGAAVTARLCQNLRRDIAVIGLNVRSDNLPALACYRRVGFEVVGVYEEWAFEME